MNALRAPADPTEAASAWPVESLRFAPRTDNADRWSAQRAAIGVGVVLLHVLFWWVFEAESRTRRHESTQDDEAIAITWIETLPRQVIFPDALPTPEPREPRPRREAIRDRPQPQPRRTTRAIATHDAPLQLYLPDGSVRLPDGLMQDIDPLADERQFDFKMPDLGKAARLLDRPPALVYEPTRFDQYWEPDEDLLTEVLRKAVEKTTKEVRIPIPGAPGRFLVCRVSLLAAGGACGVERNGGNDVVSLDDPKTLSPVEAEACEAWWNRIVGASTQDEWRATRRLYEAECRKPLAKVPPEAAPAQP
jgi:hypothetical protein